MKRLLRHIYPGLICGIIIMVLCGLPGSCFPKVKTFWEWLGPDKIAHLLMFGALAFSILWGYRTEYRTREKPYRTKLQWVTFLIVAAYSALTELLQVHLFIGRDGNRFDFYADVIGCLLGIFIFKIIFLKKIEKK